MSRRQRTDCPHKAPERQARHQSLSRSFPVGEHQLPLARILDENGEEFRGLRPARIARDPMAGAGILGPALARPVDPRRLVIDGADDLAGNDVGVYECRRRVPVRRRCSSGRVDDLDGEKRFSGHILKFVLENGGDRGPRRTFSPRRRTVCTMSGRSCRSDREHRRAHEKARRLV